jgi:hypothetical protein
LCEVEADLWFERVVRLILRRETESRWCREAEKYRKKKKYRK